MTATTLTAPTTRPATRRSAPAKQLWKTAAIAGGIATMATVAVAATAQALDVPIEVGDETIPLLGFAQLTIVGAIIGALLATVLTASRRSPGTRSSSRPSRSRCCRSSPTCSLTLTPRPGSRSRFTRRGRHRHPGASVPALGLNRSDLPDSVSTYPRRHPAGCTERITMTQYMLSVWHSDKHPIPDDPETMQKAVRNVDTLNEELKATGVWVFAGGLHPASTATVVCAPEGRRRRHDRRPVRGDQGTARRVLDHRGRGPRCHARVGVQAPRRHAWPPSRCGPFQDEPPA